MKHFFALLAVALLMLAATQESHAQKGAGGRVFGWGGGYAGNGYGQMYGGHMPGYGYGGGYGGGYYNGHSGVAHYHGFHGSMYNVPMIPPPAYQAGPPTAAVTYPYYTVRGPRDFLMNDPPSLGP